MSLFGRPTTPDIRPGVFAWYPASSRGERRTFWICYAGHLLDAMDTQRYSFAIPSRLVALALTRGQAGEIAQQAGAHELMLIHYSTRNSTNEPLILEAQQKFSGKVGLAEDYLTLEF